MKLYEPGLAIFVCLCFTKNRIPGVTLASSGIRFFAKIAKFRVRDCHGFVTRVYLLNSAR